MTTYIDLRLLERKIQECARVFYAKLQREHPKLNISFEETFDGTLKKIHRIHGYSRFITVLFTFKTFEKIAHEEEIEKALKLPRFYIQNLLSRHTIRMQKFECYEEFYVLMKDSTPFFSWNKEELTFVLDFRFKYTKQREIKTYHFPINEEHKEIADFLINTISTETGVEIAKIISESREEEPVFARTIFVILFLAIYPKATSITIGKIICRDHATIFHYLKIHEQSLGILNQNNRSAKKYKSFLGVVVSKLKPLNLF